jgi:hypothetical protein
MKQAIINLINIKKDWPLILMIAIGISLILVSEYTEYKTGFWGGYAVGGSLAFFIKRLFCKHSWQLNRSHNFYCDKSPENPWVNIKCYECNKCGASKNTLS